MSWRENSRPVSLRLGRPAASRGAIEAKLPDAVGAAWGELPGEVRTRLTQEWRARYGEQYEQIIQRYFRNLADAAEELAGQFRRRRSCLVQRRFWAAGCLNSHEFCYDEFGYGIGIRLRTSFEREFGAIRFAPDRGGSWPPWRSSPASGRFQDKKNRESAGVRGRGDDGP